LSEKTNIAQFKKRSINEQFNHIVQTYSKDLYWVIRPIVKTHEDTDDVLQNVFIKVYRYLPEFRFDSKLFSWLYRIAVNEALNHLKKMAKHKAVSVEDYMIQALRDDNYYDGDEILLQLQKAVISLPAKQQEVFRLKYFNEMKYEEMSQLLDTSVGSLKASYHIAVKKIKEIITKD